MKILNQKITDRWSMYNGDCVEVLKGIPDDSIHYSIFSPLQLDVIQRGIELKESYYNEAIKNCEEAVPDDDDESFLD